MAVTANQPIKKQDGCKRSYPVEEATRIYQGTLVFLNAAGYACDVTATGVNAFIGIAVGEADNTNGADGAIEVEVWTEGDFELTLTGGAQAEVGSPVYADDNYALVVALGATSVRVGRIVRHISSTKAIVAIKANTGVGALEVAPLTTITIADAAGTPDYALQAVINSNAYGFASAAEAISTLYVIQNLQRRVLDLEARLK
jgi:predicted RecA/RadA family phage recombinase